MDKNAHIAQLIVKKIKGTISDSEWNQLEKWINQNEENKTLFTKATSTKEQLSKLDVYNLFDTNASWQKFENNILETKVVKLSARTYLKYAAAIILPIAILSAVAIKFLKEPATPTLASIDETVKPGSQKAILVLSDGNQVDLEKNSNQTAINDGNVKITHKNKRLSYTENEEAPEEKIEIIYNELITPYGGGYNLTLADGTEVWLNAGSTLKFPVSFADTVRKVFLEGEGFFKVSHNGKPFIVNSGEMDVRVLGTSFNISAYKDDSEIKTTLVEGKVKIDFTNARQEKESTLLSPNKQAIIKKSNEGIEVIEVNTAQYTSWMNNKIEFNNETLDEVMKRLARWYNFSYTFENEKAKGYHFTARINNTENISDILKMLELTTDVKFKISENTIVVK